MGLVETLGYYLIVFNAGHDTTRHSLSGAMAAFLDHPEEFARLKADPSLIKTAVEEIVRWTAPVNYMKRTALRDYQLDDTLIREGEAVAMFYGAANRDEEVFDDPDRFDVGRTPTGISASAGQSTTASAPIWRRQHRCPARADGRTHRLDRTGRRPQCRLGQLRHGYKHLPCG